jgi:nucleotide-binding universal stress UspA family protein
MQNLYERKYRLILVPLDGSDFAEHALPTALRLARDHGAALHIVRVYVPVAGVYGERAVPYDAALDRELMKQAKDYLDGVVKRLAEVAGIRSSSVLLEGSVADTISAHAEAIGADLLVMTTQGRGPLARFWLGSVADELVRQANIPILFVRSQSAAPDFSQEPAFGRVLIPLDGSPLAERVLGPVFALDTGAQTEYTLLRVVTPLGDANYSSAAAAYTGFREARKELQDDPAELTEASVTPPPEMNYGSAAAAYAGLRDALEQLQELDRAESNGAHAYLERLAQDLRGRSFTVNTRVITNDRPASAILDDASAQGADLIALATRGRGGLKRFVLGSVADKVLRGANTAVLVYRPVDESSPTEARH